MNNSIEKAVIDLKDYIENTEEYKKVILLKNKMKDNSTVQELIKEVKKTQQEYIKSNRDEKIEAKLKDINKKLNDIPIYHEYVKELDKVNDMIYIVKEELNEYFVKKMNI